MTLRDRYRDLIDQGTSSLPSEAEAFDRLTRKAPSRKPRVAVAVAGLLLASSAAIALFAIRSTNPPPAVTRPESGWHASSSLSVASSDRPGQALEIVITAAKEDHP